MKRLTLLVSGLLTSGLVAGATPPPVPKPVPPEMLAGGTLRLPVRDTVVLIDAPADNWTWNRLSDTFYTCVDFDPGRRVIAHALDVFVVLQIPTRRQAQAAFNKEVGRHERKTIASWEDSAIPVPRSIRYTMVNAIGANEHRSVGYYTPEGINLIGPDDGSESAQRFARFVASYRLDTK